MSSGKCMSSPLVEVRADVSIVGCFSCQRCDVRTRWIDHKRTHISNWRGFIVRKPCFGQTSHPARHGADFIGEINFGERTTGVLLLGSGDQGLLRYGLLACETWDQRAFRTMVIRVTAMIHEHQHLVGVNESIFVDSSETR
jgi:hypothetical protein